MTRTDIFGIKLSKILVAGRTVIKKGNRYIVTLAKEYDNIWSKLNKGKSKVNVYVKYGNHVIPIGHRSIVYDNGCKMFIIYLPKWLNDTVWSKIEGQKVDLVIEVPGGIEIGV